ncbi:hypothetical protein SAY86_006760 [Trapa natans]|uniref:NAD(P)-binding domain-containing protein n=1 Tax=Trapa natans TaxID=22666 RepID=A0AAN7L442_TRANT|nr:hypothetical protein SAY86_006760 [Trapa natans]
MEMEKRRRRVCVTGAGGFVASWVVKLLLSKGFTVHGTVRDLGDDKNAHLIKLDGASDNLKLFKADLLDYDSLRSAIMGCDGVLHVACPVPISEVLNPEARIKISSPSFGSSNMCYLLYLISKLFTKNKFSQAEILQPAINGTLNVLKASSEANVGRVVYVSSTAAVLQNPSWPRDRVKDESSWTDKEYIRAAKVWYILAKTEAESAAFEYGKQSGLDVVSVNPGYVLGPVMRPILIFSTMFLTKFVQGIYFDIVKGDSVPNKIFSLVDVRDLAQSILLLYEKPEAEGRYICTAHNVSTKELVETMRNLYPEFTYLDEMVECDSDHRTSSEKLQKLGWTYRRLEETLADSIESFRDVGLI